MKRKIKKSINQRLNKSKRKKKKGSLKQTMFEQCTKSIEREKKEKEW